MVSFYMQIQWNNGLSALFLIFTSKTCNSSVLEVFNELACKNKGKELFVQFKKAVKRRSVCFILMEINLMKMCK